MKVVRESKFRHVFGDTPKERYEDLRTSTKATESSGIRGNSRWIVLPWEMGGGGALAVLDTNKHGRVPRETKLIMGHQGPILDFELNPFDDYSLMSCSEDLTIKTWQIPEEGVKEHIKEAVCTLEGHQKKVMFCTYNPSAEGVIASAGFDLAIKTWSLDEEKERFSINVSEQVNHLKWSPTGSLLAMTTKDKRLSLVDPRMNTFVSSNKIHTGAKPSKVEWLAGLVDNHMLATTGFTPQAERQIGVWDMRMFSNNDAEDVEPLNMLQLDNGTGALFPFFDVGTQMLFTPGKGDGNVRFFEAVNDSQFLYYLGQYSSTVAQKAFDFLPKRALNTKVHEVMRGLKLEASALQPVSFRCPRKGEAFQEDLYPSCIAGQPAMTGEDFFSGKECKSVVMMPQPRTGEDEAGSPQVPVKTALTAKDLKKMLSEAEARIGALEKENELLKKEIASLRAGAEKSEKVGGPPTPTGTSVPTGTSPQRVIRPITAPSK